MTEKQRRPLTLKRDSAATPEASRLEERLHKVLAQAGLGSRRFHEVLDALVRRLGAHREHQLVDRDDHQHRHRVAVVARQAALDLARHDHRRSARDHMRVALLVDQVVEADGAAAAGAVVHVERHRRPLVLVDDAGDGAHQVVGAAARRIGNDDFDRALRVLRLGDHRGRGRKQHCANDQLMHGDLLRWIASGS